MGKKRNGHYCVVCASVFSNEKFSGKGHSRHICKKCSKKSSKEQDEQIKINKIYSMIRFMNLSRNNKKGLNKYLNDDSKRVREQRIIPLAKSLIVILQEYLTFLNQDKDQYLFCSIYGDKLTDEGLSSAIPAYNQKRGDRLKGYQTD